MWIKRGPVFKEVSEHTYNTVFKARGFEPVEEPAQPETDEKQVLIDGDAVASAVSKKLADSMQSAKRSTKKQVKKDA